MHANVPQAFLRSEMDTDVFVKLVKGISLRKKSDGVDPLANGMSPKLINALYGLR